MITLLLFDVGDPLPAFQRIPRESRCIPAGATNGRGPAGETCGSCEFLCHVTRGKYKKCSRAQAAWTRGTGSDIFAGWPACEEWKPIPKGERL